MAVLRSEHLSFDFRYIGFEYEWVQYQFSFLWQNEPIVKDEILKRSGDYWGGRPESAFLASEDQRDRFVPFLRKILETDQADYWEPIEPDIVVAIYPGDYFPFLKSHLTLIYESDESKLKRAERAALKTRMGKLPDDRYTFVAFVDAYNFKGADAYLRQGLSLQLIVERRELEKFADDLEIEYQAFRAKFNVDTEES